MSLRNREVRLQVLNLRNRRLLQDQKNVPLSSILSNREWSIAENRTKTFRGGACCERNVGGKKQSQQDREDEKLGEEVEELKGGKKKQSVRSREDEAKGEEAHTLGKDYAKEIMENEPHLKGSGFLGDFWKGFKSVIHPVSQVVSSVAHLIPHPVAQAVATGADVAGAVTGDGKKQSEKDKEDEKLGMEVKGLKNVEKKGGKRRRKKAGSNDKRKRRGALVAKLMKEKKMTIGQASKYIKANNLKY